jgi:hypothetical protein
MQPDPIKNDQPECWPSVISRMAPGTALVQMMLARHELGKQRYGVGLQPFNGRDALQDAMEEILDLIVYLEQAAMEGNTGLWAIQDSVIVVAHGLLKELNKQKRKKEQKK